MRLNTAGAETQHRHADGFTTGGTSPAFVTTNVRSGSYAWRFTTTSRIEYQHAQISGRWHRARLWVRFENFPSAAQTILSPRSGGTILHEAEISASGAVSIRNGTGSGQLSLDTWHCLEIGYRGDGSTLETVLRLDGIEVSTRSQGSIALIPDRVQMGMLTTPATVGVFNADDFAINDDTGTIHNSWPDVDGKVVLLLPTSDSAIGADWILGGGGAVSGNAYDSVNNVPPAGLSNANTTDRNSVQIRNGVSNASGAASQADVSLASYSSAGIVSGDTVTVLHPIAITGDNHSTSAFSMAFQLLSNPAEGAETSFQTPASGAGTYNQTTPSGWGLQRNPTIENPTVTLGTSPALRIAKRQTTTSIVMCCFLGLYVEYEPSVGQTVTQEAGDSIASAEAFGTGTITTSISITLDDGVSSAEAFETPAIELEGPVQPTSIDSAEAFGTPRLQSEITVTILEPDTIGSQEAVPAPSIEAPLAPLSISSQEVMPTPIVVPPPEPIMNAGEIVSREAFGTPALLTIFGTLEEIPGGSLDRSREGYVPDGRVGARERGRVGGTIDPRWRM